MKVSLFDLVLLKDGRQGTVVEINEGSKTYDIDVGSSSADWDTLYYVPLEDIEKVIKKNEE